MAVLGLPLWLILLVLTPVLFYIYMRFISPSYKVFKNMGIEHVPPSMLCGNFGLSIKLGVLKIQTELYNRFRDHKVYGFYDFRDPILIIKDLDMLKEIFVKQFKNFVNRRVVVEMQHPMNESLLSLKDDHWKLVRNTVSPAFSSAKIKRISGHVERNTKVLLESLREKQERNEDLDIKTTMSHYTLDNIAGTVYGININSLKEPDCEFAKQAKNAMSFGSPMILILIYMFPSIVKHFERIGFNLLNENIFKYFAKCVDSALTIRKTEHQDKKVKDFLDLVIEVEAEGKDAVSPDMKKLTRSEIQAQAVIFLFAGYESVSTALSFTMFLLANHPDYMKRAQEEIDEQLNGEFPDYENIQKLEFMDMCFNEAIRMYPPSAFVDRVCTQDTVVQGIPIPKGMPVLIPIFAIHNDPDLWPEPDKFNPERFSSENKSSIPPYAHIPFGYGPRNCIGMRLALMEMKIALAAILQEFSLVPCSKTVFPVTLSKMACKAVDGLWVKMEIRK